MASVNSPIFAGISDEELQCMRRCFSMYDQYYQPEDVIYEFIGCADNLGILVKGSALIERIDEQGNCAILEHLSSGSVFGEKLMFNNIMEDRIAVICEKPCLVWFIRGSQLTKRCTNACACHQQMLENMFHLVVEKATALSARVEILSRRSIREKLLCYFRMQAAQTDGHSFQLPFSLSALADYISTDRSAMMRELKKMRLENLIIMNDKKVTII